MRYLPLFVLLFTPALTVGFTACPNPGPGPNPPTPSVDASLDAGPGPVVDAGPTPNPPPGPDAAPAPVDAGPVSSPCASACAALAAVSCPIGNRLDCAAALTRILGTGKVPNKATGRPLTCDDVKLVRTQLEAESEGFTCQ